MSSLNHQNYIADTVKAIPSSGIRKFFTILNEMKDVISLSVGEPDVAAPEAVRNAAAASLQRGQTSYTDNCGIQELREGIAAYLSDAFKLNYDPDEEIIVTVGVSEALDLTLRTLLNPGDKVLYHEPAFVSYRPLIDLCHAKGIVAKTRAEDNFALKAETLEQAWEPGVKVLILNFPTNPTGGTLDNKELERIAQFVRAKDLIVISDEIYAELSYETPHNSFAANAGLRERTIFLHGFSKAFAMTGLRVGYACGPAEFIQAMTKVHQYAIMCAPVSSQYAALAAFDTLEEVETMRQCYQRRRDFLCKALNELGLSCHKPLGAFYAFASIQSTGLSSMDFAQKLLYQNKVALVPGSAFGASGEGFVRTSFAASDADLERAVDAIAAFLKSL